MASKKLNKTGREEVALALIFLKDWKCQGKFDVEITLSMIKLADYLGVRAEYDRLILKIPPMKITERY